MMSMTEGEGTNSEENEVITIVQGKEMRDGEGMTGMIESGTAGEIGEAEGSIVTMIEIDVSAFLHHAMNSVLPKNE